MNVFELLGMAGIAISVLAYLPQLIHLGREHCSAGVSGRAWAMWLASSLLVGALAVHRRDPVFIMLQLSSLSSATVIVFLVHRYRGLACEAHAHLVPDPRPERDLDAKATLGSRVASGASLEPVAEEEVVAVRPDTQQPASRAV